MENKITDLQNSMFDLKTKVDLFIHQLPSSKKGEDDRSLPEVPTTAHLVVPAGAEASGPSGHHDNNSHRSAGAGAGVDTTLVPPPVRGAIQPYSPSPVTPVPFREFELSAASHISQSSNFSHTVPQLEFPKFDGTNPKIWIKRCENYFDICAVLPEHWVKLATMHFSGSAIFWMQSIELDLRKLKWESLCKVVIERFQRDEHNLVTRQFFHIKQTGSVSEYIELFDELVHQLLAHDPYFNPSVITSRFDDGLKNEIKSVVLVHRPKDLDTASSLAMLQEEVLVGFSSKDVKRQEVYNSAKGMTKPFNSSSASKVVETLVS